MIHGIDTSFLVAVEVSSHIDHTACRMGLQKLLKTGDQFGLTTQVLAEFIHVVTDPKRFASPLTMAQAVERAETWWNATETVQIFPTPESTLIFLGWLKEHQLGRKRLLDTMLSSTLRANDVTSVLTLNQSDFSVFGEFSFPK